MGAAPVSDTLQPDADRQPERGLKRFVLKLWRAWATRSLAIGAVATVIDLGLGGIVLRLFNDTRSSAMLGTLVGSTFTFFANRYFAFREANPKLAAPALRFIVITVISSIFHAQLVVILRDRWGVPYVPSKMIADVCVFTFAQLFVLRYIVFPKPKDATSAPSR